MIPTDMARDPTESPSDHLKRESPPDLTRPWLVFYDADCRFCIWVLALLLTWDRERRLEPAGLQTETAARVLAELTPEERAASWHLVSPAGERASGGPGLAVALALLPGGGPPAAVLARIPRLTDPGYRLLAEHRVGLSRWVPSRWKRWGAQRVADRERLSRP